MKKQQFTLNFRNLSGGKTCIKQRSKKKIKLNPNKIENPKKINSVVGK